MILFSAGEYKLGASTPHVNTVPFTLLSTVCKVSVFVLFTTVPSWDNHLIEVLLATEPKLQVIVAVLPTIMLWWLPAIYSTKITAKTVMLIVPTCDTECRTFPSWWAYSVKSSSTVIVSSTWHVNISKSSLELVITQWLRCYWLIHLVTIVW